MGLDALLKPLGIEDMCENFESLYGRLAASEQYAELVSNIESAVENYFRLMALPDDPTLYDHLILSLRPKDCIATFNWDPFLWDARERLVRLGLIPKPPELFFLHGNVRLGICYAHKLCGPRSSRCPVCGQEYTPSRLLFPVEHKDYARDPFIHDQWNGFRHYLKHAYMVTIFGYGTPRSDVEAIGLMKEAWGRVAKRNLEQIEIIDLKPKEELLATWDGFIHTHHYQTALDLYNSWIAVHILAGPVKSCGSNSWNADSSTRIGCPGTPNGANWPIGSGLCSKLRGATGTHIIVARTM